MKKNTITILTVDQNNADSEGFFCIKNTKAAGHKSKINWFCNANNKDCRIFMALDENKRKMGFVEFTTSESAWRPVKASNYLFIQCITLLSKDDRNQGVASLLIEAVETEAKKLAKSGVCTMSSYEPWVAEKAVFEKNKFTQITKLGRFELMAKVFDDKHPLPELFDWTAIQAKYPGWLLLYADQCPWHEKSVTDLKAIAAKHNIDLKIKKLESPQDAQKGPSGFGTFSLLHNGKLLADHYLSKTRFENILKAENK